MNCYPFDMDADEKTILRSSKKAASWGSLKISLKLEIQPVGARALVEIKTIMAITRTAT